MRFGALPGLLGHTLLFRPTFVPRLLAIIIAGQKITVPLYAQHNTVHAYTHGRGAAVKYLLKPCKADQVMPPAPPSQDNFVTQVTQRELNERDVCMEVHIQRQRDACLDPIEYLIAKWSGPTELVARLTIPKGTQIDQSDSCELLSFNPFHGHADNRPLGWIAVARNEIYGTMASGRLAHAAKSKK